MIDLMYIRMIIHDCVSHKQHEHMAINMLFSCWRWIQHLNTSNISLQIFEIIQNYHVTNCMISSIYTTILVYAYVFNTRWNHDTDTTSCATSGSLAGLAIQPSSSFCPFGSKVSQRYSAILSLVNVLIAGGTKRLRRKKKKKK